MKSVVSPYGDLGPSVGAGFLGSRHNLTLQLKTGQWLEGEVTVASPSQRTFQLTEKGSFGTTEPLKVKGEINCGYTTEGTLIF